MFKIVHERYKKKAHVNEAATEEFIHSFDVAIETNKELGALVNKAQVLSPILHFHIRFLELAFLHRAKNEVVCCAR
jgi:hypothetical protein